MLFQTVMDAAADAVSEMTPNSTVVIVGFATLLLKDFISGRRSSRRRKAELEDAERVRRWDLEDRERKAAEAHKVANDAAKVALAKAEQMAAELELINARRAAELMAGTERTQAAICEVSDKVDQIKKTSEDTLSQVTSLHTIEEFDHRTA